MYEGKIKYVDGNGGKFVATKEEADGIFDEISKPEYDNVASVMVQFMS